MEFIITLVIALVAGLTGGSIIRYRFKATVFNNIAKNVALGMFIMFFSFGLFMIIGWNVWSITIIPIICLILLLIIIRNAIGKLLETK